MNAPFAAAIVVRPTNYTDMHRALIIALLLLIPAVSRAEEELNLFTWSEYIDPTVITDFEKQFHCKVNVDLYEDNEGLLAKMDTGGVSAYDVIVPSDYVVRILIAKGHLAPLRKERIPNIGHIDERFKDAPYDRGNVHSVPFQWGTLGILARQKPGQDIDQSWALFFDPAKKIGPFAIIDSVRDAMAIALKYGGSSINSTSRESLLAAGNRLRESKKRSLGFDSGVGAKNRVLGGSLSFAAVFNGDAVRAMREDSGVTFFVPREGSEIWVDNLAIPSAAPHRDLAEAFLNFMLEPEVGARISNFNQFASPNKASVALVRAEDRSNPAIYPPADVMSRLEFLEDVGSATPLYDEVWTSIKGE